MGLQAATHSGSAFTHRYRTARYRRAVALDFLPISIHGRPLAHARALPMTQAHAHNRSSPLCSAPFSVCVGGSVSWAWTADKLGWQSWVDLSKAVGNWTNASGIEPLDMLAWTAPAAASMRSFPAQFVAFVLALGTNAARPSSALMSDAAYTDECIYLTWSDIDEEILSDAHVLSRCVLYRSSVRSEEQAEASSAPRHWVQGEKELECNDLLGGSVLSSYFEAGAMATLVQVLPAYGSCAGGCSMPRPLWKETKGTLGCVRPTCADVKPLCNNITDAGALTRYLCGVTCGCGDLTSDLPWIGPNLGCISACQEKATKAVAESATCSDAQPSDRLGRARRSARPILTRV
jgi:hypothetical protein